MSTTTRTVTTTPPASPPPPLFYPGEQRYPPSSSFEKRLNEIIGKREWMILFITETFSPWPGGVVRKYTLRARKENGLVETLATWQVSPFPGCCGILVETQIQVLEAMKKKGLGGLIHEMNMEYAKGWNYTVLLGSDLLSNEPTQRIISSSKGEKVYEFVNSKTLRRVGVYVWKLKEVAEKKPEGAA
jgi:hypothetical protein